MGNYIRAVLEPTIPGMHWEAYLGVWRSKFGGPENQGWLTKGDRAKHIFALSGLYLMFSAFSFCVLLLSTAAPIPIAAGAALLLILLVEYVQFFRLYGKTETEFQKVKKTWPMS